MNYRSALHKPSHISAFTLVEILIVVSIMAVLAAVFLINNLSNSLKTARDSKRKQDLTKLAQIMEDYYNDHGGYPPPDIDNGIILNTPWGGDFSPYVEVLPKDPSSPTFDYFYQSGLSTQNFFVIYTRLENTSDLDIGRLDCEEGCGPGRNYNYFVASPNIVMLAGVPSKELFPDSGLPGEEGYDGGEGGGGGPTLTPTDTPIPVTVTPTPTTYLSPTPTPTIVVPTPVPGTCGHDQDCWFNWCGAPTTEQGGVNCAIYCYCCYSTYWGKWQGTAGSCSGL